MSNRDLDGFLLPASRLEDAISALLSKTGWSGEHSSPQDSQVNRNAPVAERIEYQVNKLGFEAAPLETTFAELADDFVRACPFLVQIESSRFLAVLKASGRQLGVLTPGGQTKWVSTGRICQAIRLPVEKAKRHEFQQLFTQAGLAEAKAERATAALLGEQFGGYRLQNAWILRQPISGTSVNQFLQQAGVLRNSAYLIGVHLAEYLLWLAAWAVMGQVSFSGRMDRGWLTGWGLLLLTTVPFRIATTWLQGVLAIGMGANLKIRLLTGALNLDTESLRHLGVGSFLSQVLESEAVETLALSGGVAGLLASIELVISGLLLGPLAALLAGWCLLTGWLAWRFCKRYERWTGGRMAMTGDLIESMVGHRTRSAQLAPEDWHKAEDVSLTDYFARSHAIDSTGMWLVAAAPRGWLIAGLLWLVPTAMSGASTGSALAVKLGGVLLAYTALKKLTTSAVDIVAAAVAGRRIAPLFRAAAQGEAVGQPMRETQVRARGEKILEADRVTFRYPSGQVPALQPSSLTVRCGEKILLEGSSGGGKTTFASLLSGIRNPASGLLLLNGLDSHTIGPQKWRRKIAAAPQFHENYILTDTLAFNLLLGRQWPPSQQDLEEAEALCRKLGLGDLLDRMPGGIEQMVGEGGWQLSHGERSRIFVARALLQRAEMVILDESFGALDPENLQAALNCTLAEAETLLVIAHP